MALAKKKKKRRKGHYHRGEYVSTKTGSIFKYRSGWELKYMQFLDVSDDVVFWGYELLAIEYVSNKRTGKIRKYYPDFSVTYRDGSKKIIEIKQARKLKQAETMKKASAAHEWCGRSGIVYEILTEVELKLLGLL